MLPFTRFKLQNIPALKNENRSLGMAYQWPHLVLVVKYFNYDGKEEKGFGGVATCITGTVSL